MRHNLFVPNKLPYAKGKNRPDVPCILCAIVEKNDKVQRLEVHRTERFTISLNLYPYSPGHLLVFPNRHVVDVRELHQEEVQDLHELQCLCFEALTQPINPTASTLVIIWVMPPARVSRIFICTLSLAIRVNWGLWTLSVVHASSLKTRTRRKKNSYRYFRNWQYSFRLSVFSFQLRGFL